MKYQQVADTFSKLTPIIPYRHLVMYNSMYKRLCLQFNSTTIIPPKLETNSAITIPPKSETKNMVSISQEKDIDASSFIQPNSSIYKKSDSISKGNSFSDFRAHKQSPEKRSDEIKSSILSQSPPIDNSNLSTPSGRSRGVAMLNATLGNKSASKERVTISNTLLNTSAPRHSTIFQEIEGLNCGKRKREDNPASSNNQTKVACSICNEKVSNPYAARCGHVNCIKCWENWIKVRPSCPQCREPISLSSLTKITIVE